MPPVADVIIANDLGAAEGEQATNGFADDHAADVADVELFGGIGGTEINDVALSLVQGSGPGFDLSDRALGLNPSEQRSRRESEIDEARTGDGGGAKFQCGGGQGGDELFGDGAGVEFTGFGVGEHAVGLEIAVSRVSGAQLRVKSLGFELGAGGGGSEGCIERSGEVKRYVHRLT